MKPGTHMGSYAPLPRMTPVHLVKPHYSIPPITIAA